MSVVTNVVLSFDLVESWEDDCLDVIERINKFFPVGTGFKSSVNEGSGGTKNMEHPTYAAAFNYFDLRSFIEHLRSLKWESPQHVQLMVCGQEEDEYTMFRPCL